MRGTPQGMSQQRTAFVRSCVRPSMRSLKARRRGRATEAARGATCFLAIPSVSSTSFAAMALRSSPSHTVGVAPGTGGHDSEAPYNRPLERPGMSTSTSTERTSDDRGNGDAVGKGDTR